MHIRLIFQGQVGDESVGKVLEDSFLDPAYTRFFCLVAFTSQAGAQYLTDLINRASEHLTESVLILGVDNRGTSKEALEELLGSLATVLVFHTTSPPIFHPKLYLFEGETKVRVVVGSTNLTVPGLFQNVEAAIVVDFEPPDGDGARIVAQIRALRGAPSGMWATNLAPLTRELIDFLEQSTIAPPEAARHSEDRKEDETHGTTEEVPGTAFGDSLRRRFPPTPVPAGPARPRAPKPGAPPGGSSASGVPPIDGRPPVAPEPSPPPSAAPVPPPAGLPGPSAPSPGGPTARVLIAELPKASERWNQANFDIGNYRGFFHLEPGRPDRVHLFPIAANGDRGPPEDRPSVSVRSHNYRLELGQAAHKPYPPTGRGRPIAVFVREAERTFRYRVFMPDDPVYREVEAALSNLSRAPAREVRRTQLDYDEFKRRVPRTPL